MRRPVLVWSALAASAMLLLGGCSAQPPERADPRPSGERAASASDGDDGPAQGTGAENGDAAEVEGCPSHVVLPEESDPRVCTTPDPSGLVPVEAAWTRIVERAEDCAGACPIAESGPGFVSPGGNLGCLNSDRDGIACGVINWGFPAQEGWVSDSGPGPVVLSLEGPQPYSGNGAPGPATLAVLAVHGKQPDATELDFTQAAQIGPTAYCAMQYFGVTCWDTEAGTGLLLSRDQWISWDGTGARTGGDCATCGKYHPDATPK